VSDSDISGRGTINIKQGFDYDANIIK